MTEPQSPLSDDELLSAYLDGALAGDDFARAQRLLAEQPSSRQLLAELQSLASELRELPRGRLGDAFPERVMRKAERELLTEAAPPATVPLHSVGSRLRNPRPWIYAAATLAAGVLVAVCSWPQRSERQLAENVHAPASAAGEASPYDRMEYEAAAQAKSAPANRAPTAAAPARVMAKVGGVRITLNAAGADNGPAEVPIKAALSSLGLVQLSDEIVRQVIADEDAAASPSAGAPLSVWSCTVSPAAIQQDALGQVLLQNRVQVVDEQFMEADDRKAVDALQRRQANTSKQWVDVVLVTATPGQLGATLQDLRSQSKTFRNLTNFGDSLAGLRPAKQSRGSAATMHPVAPPQAPGPAGKPESASTSAATRAASGEKSKQPQGAPGAQQGEGQAAQSGRAIRLRVSSSSGAAMQPSPPATPGISQQSTNAFRAAGSGTSETQSRSAMKDDSQTTADRLTVKSEQAAPLERALFILNCPQEPAAAGVPLAKEATAKEAVTKNPATKLPAATAPPADAPAAKAK